MALVLALGSVLVRAAQLARVLSVRRAALRAALPGSRSAVQRAG